MVSAGRLPQAASGSLPAVTIGCHSAMIVTPQHNSTGLLVLCIREGDSDVTVVPAVE